MRQFVVFGRFERICEVDGEDLAEVILLEKRINEQEELEVFTPDAVQARMEEIYRLMRSVAAPSRRTPQARRQARPAFQYAIVKGGKNAVVRAGDVQAEESRSGGTGPKGQ